MGTQTNPHDDDMPAEINFSGAQRGKFFRPGAQINTPVYLDAEVQKYLSDRAQAKRIDMASLVNSLLKKDIEFIESAK